MLGAMAGLVPDLLGDERHHRMQELGRLAQHEGRDGARLVLLRPVLALQDRLGELDVPVADDAPDEFVERVGRLVEAEVASAPCRCVRLARASSPSIHLLTVSLAAAGSKPSGSTAPFISAKRVAFQNLVAKLREPSTLAGARRRRPAWDAASDAIVKRSASAPYLSISSRGSIDVALGLRHLLALLVRHQPVQVDGAERHLLHEVHAHHHHAGDPEEQDVPAGDQHAGRVVLRQLRRLVGPAERRERPQRRAEPGVEHVGIALQRRRPCRSASRASAFASSSDRATKTFLSGPYQAGIW